MSNGGTRQGLSFLVLVDVGIFGVVVLLMAHRLAAGGHDERDPPLRPGVSHSVDVDPRDGCLHHSTVPCRATWVMCGEEGENDPVGEEGSVLFNN